MPTATGGAPAADDTDSKDDDEENLFDECDFDNGMVYGLVDYTRPSYSSYLVMYNSGKVQ